MDDTFGKYTLSKMGKSIPKGFGNEDVISYNFLQSQQKLEQPKREESKPEPKDKFVFKDKQSTGPDCGGDTQAKNEKQFCSKCNVYL